MSRPTKKTDYQEYAQAPEIARLLAQEELILDITEQICEFLEKEKISRADLARRLGKSKAFVTQLLGGGRNLTLRTLADVISVLGGRCRVEIVKEHIEETDNKLVLLEDYLPKPKFTQRRKVWPVSISQAKGPENESIAQLAP